MIATKWAKCKLQWKPSEVTHNNTIYYMKCNEAKNEMNAIEVIDNNKEKDIKKSRNIELFLMVMMD